MFSKPRRANASPASVVPPSSPNICRKVRVSNAQPCSACPPTPIGWSRLWSGPAPKPSIEIEKLATRSLGIALPARGRFDRGDVDLLHLEHRFHHPLALRRVRGFDQLDQAVRHDLPGHAEFVLEPAAGLLRAAVHQIVPVVGDLFLRVAIDLE